MADTDRRNRIIGTTLMSIGGAAVIGAIVVGLMSQASEPAPEVTGSPEPSVSAEPGPSVDPAAFVTADGADLVRGGERYAYAGANAYTLMFEAPLSVDAHMQIAAEQNLSSLRAWAFFDTGTEDGDLSVEIDTRGIYFQYWDAEAGKPAFNDGPNGLERLDYVLASAAEHDITLVLPLVNNWVNFGGIDQYVRWAGGEYHDDFFTDPQIKQWYKDWVAHLMNRTNTITGIKYKDDPTVLMWELGNELRCSDSGPFPSSDECGSDMMVQWADEMSTFLREQDPNHLIAFGGEGFLCTEPDSDEWLYNCTESADPVALLALDNIDVHGIHVYPNHWEPTPTPEGWQAWAAEFIDIQGQIATDANKPYYIGEYGWLDQGQRMLVFDDWLQHFYDAGGDGSHFWVMQPADSIASPPDGLGFTQRCPGPSCELVGNWSQHMGQGVPWTDFAPIAENDFAFVSATEPTVLDVLANDKVYAPAEFDPATLDLDPEVSGVQTVFETEHGTFEVVDGVVVFTPSDVRGGPRISYSVADTNGVSTGSASLSVQPRS